MGSRFASFSFLFCILLVSQSTHTISAREITEKSWKVVHKHIYTVQKQATKDEILQSFEKPDIIQEGKIVDGHLQMMHGKDPSLNVFFTTADLKVGNRMPIYFSTKDHSNSAHLLPREEADSIPFSSAHLPKLLDLFSFPMDSPQAKAVEHTLIECELEPLRGETKFCATSLESMIDSVRRICGREAQYRVLTTNLLSNHTALLQNYTILEVPKEISTLQMLACHPTPYPYAVFYCHGHKTDNRLFQLSLGGENGERVEALGVCHVDTSQWEPSYVGFRVLGTQPGGSPVCHFFPADNLIWVASPTIAQLVV